MNKVLIIDSVASHRSNLIYQLSLIDTYQVSQHTKFEESRGSVAALGDLKCLIFITLEEGMDAVCKFVDLIRVVNQQACILAVVPSVNMDEMKALVQAGVDQVIIRPFTANQLKDKIQSAEKFRAQVLSERSRTIGWNDFDVAVESLAEQFYKISFVGYFNEKVKLPEANFPPGSVLFLDCDHLKGINSIGIRLWMLWFKELKGKGVLRFEFENLRHAILQQVSFVQGFIPENSSINSFYLYYSNDDLGDEKEFKISRGKEFATDRMVLPRSRDVKVGDAILKYEIDPSIKKVLNFYKGQIDIK